MSMYSCSDEQASEQAQTETTLKSGSPTTISLYDAMIKSQKYNQLESMKTAFRSKMNYNGTGSVLNTEQKLFAWINTNIAITGFSSYNAAIGEWNAIKQLNRAIFAENQQFFDSLRREANPQLVFYNLVNPQQPLGDDPCGCESDFTSTVNAAASTYASAATSALNSSTGNGEAYEAAQATFMLAVWDADWNLFLCTINCM